MDICKTYFLRIAVLTELYSGEMMVRIEILVNAGFSVEVPGYNIEDLLSGSAPNLISDQNKRGCR